MDYLTQVIGVDQGDFQFKGKTGLIVDVQGTLANNKFLKKQIIAIRADMDALATKEQNPHLPYQSQNEYGHLCGHDGHIAALLGAITLFNANKHLFEKNQVVRLIF